MWQLQEQNKAAVIDFEFIAAVLFWWCTV